MPYQYDRNTNKTRWGPENMKLALEKVFIYGFSCNKAALECSIPEPTLRRYLKKNKNYFPVPCGRPRNALGDGENFEIAEYIRDVNARIGLTSLQCRILIFNYVEAHKIDHNFNKDLKLVGTDWFRNFMRKNKLSLRAPEAISIEKLMEFKQESD